MGLGMLEIFVIKFRCPERGRPERGRQVTTAEDLEEWTIFLTQAL